MKNFVLISPHFPETYYQFAEALKEVGFRVFGIGDAPYNEIPGILKKNLDEYVTVFNMENVGNTIKAIQSLVDKYGPIDYLESNNEYWLHNDAILREWFNIKTGVWPEELESWQRKSQMKARFISCGVPCAKWINPTDKATILKFVTEVGYPLFIKPDIGVGAYGNYKIKNEEDIDFFLSDKNPNVDYICEQYITGNIVSFDGIADENSEVVFMTSHFFPPSVADIVKEQKEFFYYTLPQVPKDLEEAGRKVVKAFKLKKRCFHFEFFRLTENIKGVGNIGEIAILECNMRTPGGYTPDMMNFANSESIYKLYAEIMMSNKISSKLDHDRFYCACASRRDAKQYALSDEDILNKYKDIICMHGRYSSALSGDMGDRYFMAKFNNVDDMMSFKETVERKL